MGGRGAGKARAGLAGLGAAEGVVQITGGLLEHVARRPLTLPTHQAGEVGGVARLVHVGEQVVDVELVGDGRDEVAELERAARPSPNHLCVGRSWHPLAKTQAVSAGKGGHVRGGCRAGAAHAHHVCMYGYVQGGTVGARYLQDEVLEVHPGAAVVLVVRGALVEVGEELLRAVDLHRVRDRLILGQVGARLVDVVAVPEREARDRVLQPRLLLAHVVGVVGGQGVADDAALLADAVSTKFLQHLGELSADLRARVVLGPRGRLRPVVARLRHARLKQQDVSQEGDAHACARSHGECAVSGCAGVRAAAA